MRLRQGLLAITLAAAACSAQPTYSTAKTAETGTVHAESGFPIVPLTVSREAGGHRFRVEVARTSAEQAKGLMFRTRMGKDEGMIFPMEPARPASFWMKNTVIPLDIIFIGTDRRIMNIAANTVPYSEKPVLSAGKVSAVLELNAGRAAELGIAPGDKVEW